ncbi:MAG: sodium/solute symporter [Planctomycetes bacterium]|nr:sodium/solute symporter [Planctomycetota bacterium]
MELGLLDITVFVVFIASVIGIGVFKSMKEKTSEDYFLAGRGLSWWLIGFSLIAANISTEQFIGMSGSAAKWLGLAIASYEWMAAITLVVVAFCFLPKFLKSGIYTIPEYLEYRYNETARSLMAVFMIVIYVFVTFAAVVYSGALTAKTLFGGQEIFGVAITIKSASWAIGLLAAIYVGFGGLKACAWADLLQGSALIVGGGIVVILALKALGAATVEEVPALANIDETAGAIKRFTELNSHKLHMVLPKSDPEIPWTALVIGLWIPNFYYWGLNQYITQRTLGAKSLGEGQKGIVFAAALKLIIPFIIVVPGIIAFNLYGDDMKTEAIDTNAAVVSTFEEVQDSPADSGVAFVFDRYYEEVYPEKAAEIVTFNAAVAGMDAVEGETAIAKNGAALEAIAIKNKELAKEDRVKFQQTLIGYKHDSAFALLIKRLVPKGLRGFMIAALLGAVMSSLASMLNSASTIFTMDIYKKYLNKGASQTGLVTVGRICVGVFAVIGCFIAPLLDDPKFGGIFKYIQEFQGYISPGILAVFVFGLTIKKAPPLAGVVGLIINPPIYFILAQTLPGMAFLDRMALSFFSVLILMTIITVVKPLKVAVVMPVNTDINLEHSNVAKVLGVVVIIATLILYAIFW